MKKIILYISLLNILFILKILSAPIQNLQNEDRKIYEILKESSWIKSKPQYSDSTIFILDFWATWCAPCISSFPHINKLANKFNNKSKIFISITPEKRKIVELFLKRKKLETFIFLDSTKELHNKFKVTAIPRIIIINSKDEILWDGHPILLNDSIIEKISNISVPNTKEPLSNITDSKKIIENINTRAKNLNSIFINMKPSLTTNMTKSFRDISDSGVVFNYINKPLCHIFQELLNINATRLECIFKDSINWDLNYLNSIDNDIEKASIILKNILLTIFNLKLDTIIKQFDVEKIICADSTKLNLYKVNPSDYDNISHSSSSDSLFSSANTSLDALSFYLEDIFGIPFVNVYKTSYKYNFSFDISGGIEKVKDNLMKHYGLLLRKEKENIEILIIEKK